MTESDHTIDRRLAVELADRLTEPALRCDEGEVRDVAWEEVVRVADFDVATAARCQAKAAAIPSDFEPNIFTTSRAVALESVQAYRATGSVVEAVSRSMRRLRGADRDPDDDHRDLNWLGLYLADDHLAPLDVRVRIAARATTWLTSTLDALGIDDPRRQIKGWGIKPWWAYPGRALRLEGRVDLVVKDGDQLLPVFVMAGAHPTTIDRAAFSVVLRTIRDRKPPEEIIIVELPTATSHRLPTDDMFDRGIEAAVRAADAVTSRAPAATEPPDRLSRTPSNFTCSGCHWAASCEAKSAFDDLPAQRGGIQLTPTLR